MKQLFIFTATILACMGMRAQETGIDSVLRQIEANNKELQANAHLISSQKLENKTNNNLPDPYPVIRPSLGLQKQRQNRRRNGRLPKLRLPHAYTPPEER